MIFGLFKKRVKLTGKIWYMENHQGWGNRIGWSDFEKRRISAHTSPRPDEGDELRVKMQSGKIARFALIDIDYMSDPRDMWFATAYDIGYVGEKPINKVKEAKTQETQQSDEEYFDGLADRIGW